MAATRNALRYTLDGDAALESHLTLTCERIAAGLRGLIPARKLQAVLLGGGYGRGEGGVLRTAEGDRPYNDLEFYVFLRGNRHLNEKRYGRALHVLGEILTPQAGIEVEFRISALDELASGAVSMFSYDLVSGHRWLIGDEALLAGCDHHRRADAIPLSEATRLLMNRCTGLLFAQERLARAIFTPADADFVARNIAKAQLGAGDAVLTAYGQYDWSVRERQRRLERLVRHERNAGWLAAAAMHHAQGVEFKLHPSRSTAAREQLQAAHRTVKEYCRDVWLWVESRRLQKQFRSVREYAAMEKKWPDAAGLRNALVNAKLYGPAATVRPGALRHPRERALTALPLLLWQPDALSDPKTLDRLQRELRTVATTFPAIVSAYREIWARVN